MKLSTKQKQDLIDSYVQNKDIRTDYEIVANTRTQMSFENLDKNLSLLSAIVNKHFIKGKWQKKLSERIVFDWKDWQAKQNLIYDTAIKTHQYFISWRNLVSKTILQGANEDKLKTEFARQTAYV